MPAPETWTATGLLDYFQEVDATADRRFAFILGAGASVQSGIPPAGRLVANWLQELHAREDHERTPLAQWATAGRLRITDFEYARAVEWYPQMFARRFEHRPDEGYAYLERILHGKDPSFGYSVLAQILATTRHRAVITTNFDNLVADSLAIYTNQLPFVCGHESLAAFVRPNPRRPLVVKIHRDLLLAPKNRSEELAALPEPLAAVLRALLAGFTPIVLGYGGNDGSLMNFLRDTPPGDIPGGIYWCYWARGGPPCAAALEVVERHHGAIVPIDGFDELMAMLGHRLNFPRMDQVLEQRARERVQRYRSSFEAFQQRLQPATEPPLAAPTSTPHAEEAQADEEADADDQVSAARSEAPGFADLELVLTVRPAPSVSEDRSIAEQTSPLTPAPRLTRSPAPPLPVPSAKPEPTRSPLGPVLSARSAPTRSGEPLGSVPSTRSESKHDATSHDIDVILSFSSPDSSHEAPATPEPAPETSTPDAPARVPHDDTAPLQAALEALVSTEAADWWTLKLRAEREPVPQRRIAAYQTALARFPGHTELRRGLACQLALAGAAPDAARLFHELIEESPGDAGLHLDLAVLAALDREFVKADALAGQAWQLTRAGERDDTIVAAVAFVRGLLARLQHRDDTAPLRVLRGVLRTTAIQPGGLTPMLAVVVASLDRRGMVLDRPSHRLYHRLLACLTGQATPESLEANQRWTDLTPLAPEAAWPDPA